MISIDQLAEILNNEINREFLEFALELWNDNEQPIDPEHPDMEIVLDKIAESINDLLDILPIEDDYV